MAVARVQTGIRLTETVYGKLVTVAAKNKRSVNNYVETLIEKHLEDIEREEGPIEVTKR